MSLYLRFVEVVQRHTWWLYHHCFCNHYNAFLQLSSIQNLDINHKFFNNCTLKYWARSSEGGGEKNDLCSFTIDAPENIVEGIPQSRAWKFCLRTESSCFNLLPKPVKLNRFPPEASYDNPSISRESAGSLYVTTSTQQKLTVKMQKLFTHLNF